MSERAAPPFPLLPSVKKTFCAKRAAGCSPSLGENLFGLWMSNGLGWFGDLGGEKVGVRAGKNPSSPGPAAGFHKLLYWHYISGSVFRLQSRFEIAVPFLGTGMSLLLRKKQPGGEQLTTGLLED